MPYLNMLFPFLRWFPMTSETLRADFIAGITVALVLVPQSMAYAQLAGLPVVYGLYAAFVPVIVASLWGSSNQLHTGPVAMLSLMSAAALLAFATPGTTEFIELSLMLALMVGVMRLALGIFRLGAIVNLLSSPVIIGFTNAAALIIGLSQLSKVIGVPFPRTDSYLVDLWHVIHQLPQLHWWTLVFAAGAWIVIVLLRRYKPTIPGILVAVAVATALSAAIGFEKNQTVASTQIRDVATLEAINAYDATQQQAAMLTGSIAEHNRRVHKLEQTEDLENTRKAQALRAETGVLDYKLEHLKEENNARRIALHAMVLQGVTGADGTLMLYGQENLPEGSQSDGEQWRFVSVNNDQVTLSAGGAVVGLIPDGLPEYKVPVVKWDLVLALFPYALVMALIGFMEATSISKAIATRTGDRVDTSKELIGQGLANIAGSFFGSYTVSGSFSRSAVAARTGARTGLFAIISALAVVCVLLFFTSYLYHLPQAVLAVIVMMAVFSLIRIKPLVHAWKIDRVGATIGGITFVTTFVMAPAIADGILLGILLTVLHFLIQTMRPRAEIVGRKADGTLGGISANRLKPISKYFVPVRFDGSLSFINVAYFEDIILEAHADYPDAKMILVVGSGINDIDASGEEKVREVANRLRKVDVKLVFSGLKHQVRRVMEKSGLVEELGSDSFFSDKETALRWLCHNYKCAANSSIAKQEQISETQAIKSA
jgi:MFS superfamily sulfate permease-like transporter